MVAAAMIGTAAVGAFTANRSASAQRKAASQASAAQEASSLAAIDEQRRQFDFSQELMTPFISAGNNALDQQQTLLGLNGNQAQQNAINGIQNSAEFQTYLNQGENALRQNASATGGLRGGNTQAALAQFSPQLLNQMINQKYSNLGGLTALGQNAAAGVGNAGMQTAQAVANNTMAGANAVAAGQVAAGNRTANNFSSMLGLAKTAAGFMGGGMI